MIKYNCMLVMVICATNEWGKMHIFHNSTFAYFDGDIACVISYLKEKLYIPEQTAPQAGV